MLKINNLSDQVDLNVKVFKPITNTTKRFWRFMDVVVAVIKNTRENWTKQWCEVAWKRNLVVKMFKKQANL